MAVNLFVKRRRTLVKDTTETYSGKDSDHQLLVAELKSKLHKCQTPKPVRNRRYLNPTQGIQIEKNTKTGKHCVQSSERWKDASTT